MPITLFAYLLGSLSIIGLPPFVGLWSKWWIGVGAVEAGDLWVVAVLMVSSLLNVAYLLPIFSRGFFAPLPEAERGKPVAVHEAPIPCVAAVVITALLCIALFFAVEPVEKLLVQIAPVPQDLASTSIGVPDAK